MLKKPVVTEVRTPTNTWSGLGFSKSMPAETIKELRRANHVSYKPSMTTTYEVCKITEHFIYVFSKLQRHFLNLNVCVCKRQSCKWILNCISVSGYCMIFSSKELLVSGHPVYIQSIHGVMETSFLILLQFLKKICSQQLLLLNKLRTTQDVGMGWFNALLKGYSFFRPLIWNLAQVSGYVSKEKEKHPF